MKKYISFVLTAIVALTFNACSNEDIQIDQDLTIRVSPVAVTSAFTYEVNQGELTAFDTNFELRTRLLIYNTQGKLVLEQTEYLKNYTEVMDAHPSLADGTYTLVAITDLVAKNRIDEYWTLTDADELSKVRITATKGNSGIVNNGYKRNILGIGNKKVTISASSRAFDIAPTAAGALVCVYFQGLKSFDFKQIQFLCNQQNGTCSFDVQANWTPTFEKFMSGDNNVLRPLFYLNMADYPTAENLAAYYFFLPGSTSLRVAYGLNSDTNAHYAGARQDVTLEKGVEYKFDINFNGVTSPADAQPTFGKVSSGARLSGPEASARLVDLF